MDYTWVDAGLEKLGLELDILPSELPQFARPDTAGGNLSVSHMVSKLPQSLTEPMQGVLSKKGSNFSVEVGKYSGNATISYRTICSDLKLSTKEDALKFLVDDCVPGEVAKIWDKTFVKARFTHAITRDGRVLDTSASDYSIANIPAQDVAKIMHWEFAAEGLAKRDMTSVYVTQASDKSVMTCYFPVKGSLFPLPTGWAVRSRLMFPCFDRFVFSDEDFTVANLEHVVAACLMGWIPATLFNTYLGRKALAGAATSEPGPIMELFTKDTDSGKKFASVQRRDGTVI